MSSTRRISKKKIALMVFCLLAGFIALKITLFWTAKPKVTTDYVAEYNRLTRPQNYDPNLNAADDYQKAFDSFVEMPRQLRKANHLRMEEYKRNEIILYRRTYLGVDWPSDFNDEDRKCFKEWLKTNKEAFEYFNTACHKSYYWNERGIKEDIGIGGILFPEFEKLRDLIEAKLWDAKEKAYDSQYQSAFENIINCYLAGQQRCELPTLLFEQMRGIDIKERTINACLCIVNHIQLSPQVLAELQNLMQFQFVKQSKAPSLEAERLDYYDKLQRMFVFDRNKNGRLAWSLVKDTSFLCGVEENNKFKRNLLRTCLFGPTEKEMIKNSEKIFADFELLKKETPWQIYQKDPNYFIRLEEFRCDDCGTFNFNMFISYPNPMIFHKHYRVKAKEDALLIVLAIQRFKADKGSLPSKLDELVSNGYLKDLPFDPYSDGPLVYCVEGNNFTLYSVGRNFKDDDGKGYSKDSDTDDIVFWPVDTIHHP